MSTSVGGRITWSTPDGSWGIKGVDLATLPPLVYGALMKLLRLENVIDMMASPSTPDYEVELELEDLFGWDVSIRSLGNGTVSELDTDACTSA